MAATTSIFDLSAISKSVNKTASAVVSTLRPLANGIEIATLSSEHWTETHALNLQDKKERENAVRAQSSADLMRKALAKSQQQTLATDEFEDEVKREVVIGHVKREVNNTKLVALLELSTDPEALKQLASKDGITDADILKLAKVGVPTQTHTAVTGTEATPSAFDIKNIAVRPKQPEAVAG